MGKPLVQDGCGKTHLNLADKGFIAPLYVAPSWKLARTKKKDYGCESSVFFRLLSDDPDKYRPLVRNYSVIIIDEISMLSNEFKEIILKRFRHHKLIFCGDKKQGFCWVRAGYGKGGGRPWGRIDRNCDGLNTGLSS